MGSVLTCCILDAGCGVITGTGRMLFGCMPWGKSRSSRIVSTLLFFSYCLLMLLASHYGDHLSHWLPAPEAACDAACQRYYIVYKMGIALAMHHILQAVLLLGVEDGGDSRAIIQDGFWPLKLVLLTGITVGTLFIPSWFINYLFTPTVLVGMLFLLVQAVLLVEVAYDLVETMLRKTEEGSTTFKALLIGSTLLLALGSIGVIVSIYLYFGSELDRTLISVNAVLAIIMTICSVLPAVQEANPGAGIFQASMLSLYSLLVITTAFMSDPSRPKGESTLKATYPILGNFVSVCSILVAFLAIARQACNTGNNLHKIIPDTKTAGSGDDDDEAGRYNYSLFHLGFAMASFYTILYITFWQYAIVDSGKIIISNSSMAFWVRAITSWIVPLLYCWSLFAPIILEDRF